MSSYKPLQFNLFGCDYWLHKLGHKGVTSNSSDFSKYHLGKNLDYLLKCEGNREEYKSGLDLDPVIKNQVFCCGKIGLITRYCIVLRCRTQIKIKEV